MIYKFKRTMPGDFPGLGLEAAATVIRVHEDSTVDLEVGSSLGGMYTISRVANGDGEGQWRSVSGEPAVAVAPALYPTRPGRFHLPPYDRSKRSRS